MTERGRILAEKVARRIGEVTPAGLGRWGDAWTLVEEPSDAFLDALAAWECHRIPPRPERLSKTLLTASSGHGAERGKPGNRPGWTEVPLMTGTQSFIRIIRRITTNGGLDHVRRDGSGGPGRGHR